MGIRRAEGAVYFRYYRRASKATLFFDGAQEYKTLAYTHRRVRVSSYFWAQPRCFRVSGQLLFLFRAVSGVVKRQRRLVLPQARLLAQAPTAALGVRGLAVPQH